MYDKIIIHYKPILEFLKAHLVLVLLIALGAFLRTYQLNSHGIFFFDAGHDLLAAHQAVSDSRIPLVGITSSRPWLHQGPIAIWIEMLGMIVFGTSTLGQHIVFALIGIAALIALYELITIHFDKRAAYYAVALLAVSPLAVANSRMPYHTTPIPLVTVFYLWSLVNLWQKCSLRNTLITVFTGILLFQFELSNAPLLIAIPYVFWRKKYQLNRKIVFGVAAIGLLGLLPQLLYPFFGGTNQLFEFGKWFVTQIAERLQFDTTPTTTLFDTLRAFWTFGGRIFGIDVVGISVLGFTVTTTSIAFAIRQLYRKKAQPLVELTLLSFGALTIAYLVAGPPSEAYFPPYFVIVPILLSNLFLAFPSRFQAPLVIGVFLYICGSVYTIFAANFFVMNNRAFQYDSVGEHRAIARMLHHRSNQKPYRLTTAATTELEIPAFFDHIKWLSLSENLSMPSSTGRLYYLEKNTDPQPADTIRIQAFPTKTIYWNPIAHFKP